MRCSWPAHPPHSRDQCEGSGGFLFALVPPTPGFDGHGTFLSARRVGEREQVCHMCLLFGWSLNHPIGNRLLHDPASLNRLCSCNAKRLGADACSERGMAVHARLQLSLAIVTFRLEARMVVHLPQQL